MAPAAKLSSLMRYHVGYQMKGRGDTANKGIARSVPSTGTRCIGCKETLVQLMSCLLEKKTWLCARVLVKNYALPGRVVDAE